MSNAYTCEGILVWIEMVETEQQKTGAIQVDSVVGVYGKV